MSLNQLVESLILGVIQGFTEWLPISSTGHLEIVEKFFGLKFPLLFDVVLHLGTLAVILLFFREDVKKLLHAFVRRDFKTEHGRLILLIIAGTLPTAVIGSAFIVFFEDFLQGLLTVAVALIVCGFVLYSVKNFQENIGDITLKAALIIGAAQGLALIPGLSRSGLTIAAALIMGVRKEKAFKFSFLLSVPAVIGAFGLTFYTNLDALAASSLDWFEIFAGTIAAMITGYLALKLLWKILERKKFNLFAFYCWALGVFLILAFAL